MAIRVVATLEYNKFAAIAKAIPRECGEIVRETLDKMNQTVRAGMAASTPGPSSPGAMPAIDTGALIGSLRVEMESQTSGALVEGGGAAPYAIYLEYGTSKMAPRPHLMPAAEQARPEFVNKMRDLESRL